MFKYTDGVNVWDERPESIIGITRADISAKISETIVRYQYEIDYHFLIHSWHRNSGIYLSSFIGVDIDFDNFEDEPHIPLPKLLEYYLQLDLTDDQQLMDYHNLCMNMANQVFELFDNLGLKPAQIKRSE